MAGLVCPIRCGVWLSRSLAVKPGARISPAEWFPGAPGGTRGLPMVRRPFRLGRAPAGRHAHWCTILMSAVARLLMHPRCRRVIALLA